MRGQLWQQCLVCDAEPVCVECERCARHCTCARDADDRRQVASFEKAYPGLLAQVERHHEQGAQEH